MGTLPDVDRPVQPRLRRHVLTDVWHAGFATCDGIVVNRDATNLGDDSGRESRMPAPWAGAGAVITTVAGDRFVAFVGGQFDSAQSFEVYERSELVVAGIWTSADGVPGTGRVFRVRCSADACPRRASRRRHRRRDRRLDLDVDRRREWAAQRAGPRVRSGSPDGRRRRPRRRWHWPRDDLRRHVRVARGRRIRRRHLDDRIPDLRTIGRHLQWRNRLLRRQKAPKGDRSTCGRCGRRRREPNQVHHRPTSIGVQVSHRRCTRRHVRRCGRAAAHGGIVSSGAGRPCVWVSAGRCRTRSPRGRSCRSTRSRRASRRRPVVRRVRPGDRPPPWGR